MAYRLYIFDTLTGLIQRERRLEAKDDETAVWISEGLRHMRPMELWQGGRKIHGWDALKPTLVESDNTEILSVPEPCVALH